MTSENLKVKGGASTGSLEVRMPMDAALHLREASSICNVSLISKSLYHPKFGDQVPISGQDFPTSIEILVSKPNLQTSLF